MQCCCVALNAIMYLCGCLCVTMHKRRDFPLSISLVSLSKFLILCGSFNPTSKMELGAKIFNGKKAL